MEKFGSSNELCSSSLSLMNVPVVRCPCGNGPCSVYTVNKSKKNYGKKFYSCCQRKEDKCGYFKWLDEVVEFNVPACPCGAGACSLNLHENGRWFLACRIRKGHGACQFFQWTNLHVNIRMNMHFHYKVIRCACPLCLKTSPQINGTLQFGEDEESFWDLVVQETESVNHQVLVSSHSQKVENPSWDLEMQETESSNHQGCSTLHSIQNERPNEDIVMEERNSSNHQVLSTLPSENDEVPNRLSVMSEPKSSDHLNLKKVCCVSYMVCQTENLCKSVSCMQISAEGDILNQDNTTFSGGEGSSAVVPNGLKNSEVIIHLRTPSKNAQLSSGVSRCHSPCQNRNIRKNDSPSLSIFKYIGQGLLETLEDKNLIDREEMCKIAESIFAALRRLSINNSSFSTHVMEYIDYKSRLAVVEDSMREGLSSQELEDIFNREEAKRKAAVNHCQSLYEEFSHVKKRRLHRNLGQELERSEAKTSELKTNLLKINPETCATQRSMEAAREEMEEAFANECAKKFLQEEARTALEMARAELPP